MWMDKLDQHQFPQALWIFDQGMQPVRPIFIHLSGVYLWVANVMMYTGENLGKLGKTDENDGKTGENLGI